MADDYWIDVVPPRLALRSKVGADDYHIEKVGSDDYHIEKVGDRSFGAVGADDYIINPGRVGDRSFTTTVGGGHHSGGHSRRARGGLYRSDFWDEWPIYVVKDQDVVTQEDNAQTQAPVESPSAPDPDNVGANIGSGLQKMIKQAKLPPWLASQFQAVGPKLQQASIAATLYTKGYGKNASFGLPTNASALSTLMNVGAPFWQSTAQRRKDRDSAVKNAPKLGSKVHYTAGPVLGAIAHAGGDIIHGVNAAASFAGKALSHIPVIGKPLSSAMKIYTGPIGLADNIAKGQRIDHALINNMKDQLKNVREVAPYVQQVMSFIPGVGTGVAAAIAAGVALAEGRTITQAVLDAARSAVPGGAIGQSAFSTAVGLVSGKSITQAALNAARSALPAAAQKAFDIGVGLSHAANIQSQVIKAVTKAVPAMESAGRTLVKASPVLANASKGLTADATKGYHTALGILSHSGVNGHAIMAVRSKLTAKQQEGFDHGVKTLVAQHTPHWPSLVKDGIVTRGDWKPCRPGAKGCVTGKIVQNGKVTHGTFTRA